MLSVIIRILVIDLCSTLPFLGYSVGFTPLVLDSGSLSRFSRNNSHHKTPHHIWRPMKMLYCSEPMITDNKRHLYLLVSLYVRYDSASNFDRNFVPNIQYIGIYHIYADILILQAKRAIFLFVGSAISHHFHLS